MASRFQFQSKRLGGTSATLGLIIVSCIGFILCWIPQSSDIYVPFAAFQFNLVKFWQLLTYPFVDFGVGIGFIFYIFGLLWLHSFGGLFEKEFGSKSLLAHFFGAAIGFGLLGFVAAMVLPPAPQYMYSTWLPTGFITVTICALKKNEMTNVWNIPLQFKWLAVMVAIFVIINEGAGNPLYGVVLASPLLFAWFYGSGKFGVLQPGNNPFEKRAQKVVSNREFDEFRSKVRDREKDRQEKERLRKLFEGSISDQDPPQAEK